MHLTDVRHVDQGIDAQVAHPGAGFLGGFADRGLLDGLAVFHETGGQGPVTEARFDGAATEQHFSTPGRDTASDDVGVLIVNGLTAVTDKSQSRVALGNALGHRVTAMAAKFHAWVPEGCAYLGVQRCRSASCRFATWSLEGVGRLQ